MSVTINWSALVGKSAWNENLIVQWKKPGLYWVKPQAYFLPIFRFLKQEVKRKTLKILPRTLLNVSWIQVLEYNVKTFCEGSVFPWSFSVVIFYVQALGFSLLYFFSRAQRRLHVIFFTCRSKWHVLLEWTVSQLDELFFHKESKMNGLWLNWWLCATLFS